MKRLSLFSILSIFYFYSHAQNDTIPVSATIEINNIKATVYSSGNLFGNEFEGQFADKESKIPVIRKAGLWVAGLDPGGRLRGAIHTDESDFQPGLIDPITKQHINFNKIWRVSQEEILAHLEDFRDNERIDDPNSSIYEWPGRNNPHFYDYNGFDIPTDMDLAPFWDSNGNGIYEPEDGDYPVLYKKGCYEPDYADEMLWFAYHGKTANRPSGMESIELGIYCQLFAYNCAPHEALSNTVLVNYQLVNHAVESIDSLFAGVYLDYQIGCPEDDYIGTMPQTNSVFAYNSDKNDNTCADIPGFFWSPQVTSMTFFRGLDDEFGNEVKLSKTMPLFDSVPYPGKRFPSTPEEYYNYLTGSWRDGNPLSFGDDGYQDGELVDFIFPHNPSNRYGWSEVATNQIPGKRKLLASCGPVRIDSEKTISFSIGFILDYWRGGEVFNSFHLENKIYNLNRIFHNCIDPSPLLPRCTRIREYEAPLSSKVNFAPNPVKGQLHIEFYNIQPTKIRAIGMLGRVFYTKEYPWHKHVIDVDSWPAGIYFLHVEEEGVSISKKFVVEH